MTDPNDPVMKELRELRKDVDFNFKVTVVAILITFVVIAVNSCLSAPHPAAPPHAHPRA